jgi:hypothetical protein
MELSSSIDFYMPCTLVILTYVKAGKLNTPTHPLHKDTPSLYRRLLHSAVRGGRSKLRADVGL